MVDLPEYETELAAWHRAFAPELKEILAGLPLRPADRVLDVASGDGVYSLWMAEHVGKSGRVTGIDLDPEYLRLSRTRAGLSRFGERVNFTLGDIGGLPFDDGTFDLVWCAQSFYSLPDPLAALREMKRVTRPQGTVAVLENDSLHHLILPWPAELELAIRQAELHALEQKDQRKDKYFIGRYLSQMMSQAGLEPCRIRTHVFDRQAPLATDERIYLERHLSHLRDSVRCCLNPACLRQFDALIDPDGEQSMLRDPYFTMACLNIVAWGVRV